MFAGDEDEEEDLVEGELSEYEDDDTEVDVVARQSRQLSASASARAGADEEGSGFMDLTSPGFSSIPAPSLIPVWLQRSDQRQLQQHQQHQPPASLLQHRHRSGASTSTTAPATRLAGCQIRQGATAPKGNNHTASLLVLMRCNSRHQSWRGGAAQCGSSCSKAAHAK